MLELDYDITCFGQCQKQYSRSRTGIPMLRMLDSSQGRICKLQVRDEAVFVGQCARQTVGVGRRRSVCRAERTAEWSGCN